MPLERNIQEHFDNTSSPKEKLDGARVSPSNETGAQIAQTVSKLQEGIRNDAGISPDILHALKQQIQEAKEHPESIVIAGERFSLKDLPEGTDIKEQLDICNQILSGNYANHSKLKLLPVKVAKRLAKHKGDLYLNSLTSLTPEAAAHLAYRRAGKVGSGGTFLSSAARSAVEEATQRLKQAGKL